MMVLVKDLTDVLKIFLFLTYLILCIPSICVESCTPPQAGSSMFHRHYHHGVYKFTLNTCNPCSRNQETTTPRSPVQICQFKHLLQKINDTVDLLAEKAREFEETTAPSEESICRAHHGYEIGVDRIPTDDALIDSYRLLTVVTLNITTIGRYPERRQLDTRNLQISLHHLLCEMKYLLRGEPLGETDYKQELHLPSDLNVGNLIVFSCRNLHQAIEALKFIHLRIWNSLISEV